MVIPKRTSSLQAVTSNPSVCRPVRVLSVHVPLVSRPSHSPPSVVVVPEQLDGCVLKVGEGVCHVRVPETVVRLHLVGQEKVFQGGANPGVQLFVLRVREVLVEDSLYERDIAHGLPVGGVGYGFFLGVFDTTLSKYSEWARNGIVPALRQYDIVTKEETSIARQLEYNEVLPTVTTQTKSQC